MLGAVAQAMRNLAGVGLALCAVGANAQAMDLPKGLDQLFRVLQAPETPRRGLIDTPENLDTVVRGARERRRNMVSGGGSDDVCQAAANPLRPARVQGSGWMELVAKCTAVLEQDERLKEEAGEERERQRAETERTRSAQARKESDDYEARRQALIAGLKAGSLPPKNCAQWMIGRGLDRDQLQANDVSRIGYRAPQGLGYFDGAIQQIQGENILVRLGDHLAVIAMDKNARVFRESALLEEGTLGVVGEQSGTRTLKRQNGSTLTIAVIKPACVVGAPNALLDLMPDGERQ